MTDMSPLHSPSVIAPPSAANFLELVCLQLIDSAEKIVQLVIFNARLSPSQASDLLGHPFFCPSFGSFHFRICVP